MEPEPASDEELSIESEFAATIKYIDLYLRQKTDLFLQHYVFEPFDFLAKKLMYLSVLVTHACNRHTGGGGGGGPPHRDG